MSWLDIVLSASLSVLAFASLKVLVDEIKALFRKDVSK